MSTIRKDLVRAAISRAWASIDYNIHKGFHKQYEFIKQTILADNSLTIDEKTEAIRLNNKDMTEIKLGVIQEQEVSVKIVAKNV